MGRLHMEIDNGGLDFSTDLAPRNDGVEKNLGDGYTSYE